MNLTSIAAGVSDADTLLKKYKRVRNFTLELVAPLKTEDFVVQPVIDVSPPKWHLAHTTWFFENFILKQNLKGYKVFHERYNYLFNSYYENVGERWIRNQRGLLSRPTVAEIKNYREYVDQHITWYLQNKNLSDHVAHVLELGLQHEQQHQELLLYDLKHILGLNPLYPVYIENHVDNGEKVSAENYLEVGEGLYPIGFEGDGFCFDNELGRHQVFLHHFQISDRLVTNEEYLEFMEDGGYEDVNLWHMEGWEWVNKQRVKAPFHWQFDNGWKYFTLSGFREINPAEPVTHINFYEASAFAAWRGKRLPTEFEWETACNLYGGEPDSSKNFVDNRNFHPIPGRQNNQFFGDCWEWTSSAYLPYPYYKKAEGALGEYNGKFMVNQMVLRGGSCATSRDHIRNSYRNFFHPHLKWFFTGIRLAEHI